MGKIQISVTEDAYKIAVKPDVSDLFKEVGYFQIMFDEDTLIKKLKNYKINVEDKTIRIVKPLFDENKRVIDASVLVSVTDGKLNWDRG